MSMTGPISYGGPCPKTFTFLDGSMVPYLNAQVDTGAISPEGKKTLDVSMDKEVWKTKPIETWQNPFIRIGFVNEQGRTQLCNILYISEQEEQPTALFRVVLEPPGTRFYDTEMKYIREVDEKRESDWLKIIMVEPVSRFDLLDMDE